MNNSQINRYSYCGHNCFILNCDIGSFVSIADNCRLGGANHPIDRVSSSPVFHKGKNILNKNFARFNNIPNKKVTINSDVWIGASVMVLFGGGAIGVGAVVEVGGVVIHDIPPYEIWAGNPTKKLKSRFDDKTSKKLLQTFWWK